MRGRIVGLVVFVAVVGRAHAIVLAEHVVVVLRDKKTIMGILRSFDGYGEGGAHNR